MAYRLRWFLAFFWLLAFMTWLWWMLGPAFFVDTYNPVYGGFTWQFGANGLHGVMGYFPVRTDVDRFLHFAFVIIWFVTFFWCIDLRRNWMAHQVMKTTFGRWPIVAVSCCWAMIVLATIAWAIEAMNLWHLIILQSGASRSFVPYYPVRPVIAACVLVSFIVALIPWFRWHQQRKTFEIRARIASRLLIASLILILLGGLLQVRLFLMEPLYGVSFVRPIEVMQAGDDRLGGYYATAFLGWTTSLWAGAASLVVLFTRPTFEQRKDDQPCLACGYDLRGSIAANATHCPECGAAVFTEFNLELSMNDRR